MTFIYTMPVLNLINLFCCAGISIGGFAGVYVYKKQLVKTGITLNSKDGGMIGLLSGLLSAVIVSGIGLLISLYSQSNPVLDFLDTINDAGISIPEEMTVYLENISNDFNQKGYSPTFILISFLSNLIIFPLFGLIGALIGVSVLKKNNTPQI